MKDNTRLGNYPVPNPIPARYAAWKEELPKIFVVGEKTLERLRSFGMEIEDILDMDKVYEVFTPREFEKIYNLMNFAMPGYSTLCDLLALDFQPYDKVNLIAQKNQAPTEVSKRYMDQLQFGAELPSALDTIQFQLGNWGNSIEKVPEHLIVDLVKIDKDIFALVLKGVADPSSRERYLYNVCNDLCQKLFNHYGLKQTVKTRLFSEMIRLSQLSALNQNS